MVFSNLFLNTCLDSFCFIKKNKAILIFPTALPLALLSWQNSYTILQFQIIGIISEAATRSPKLSCK